MGKIMGTKQSSPVFVGPALLTAFRGAIVRVIRLLIWAVALVPLAGCYSYATLGGWEALTVDGDIRAQVTDAGILRLSEVLPEYDNRAQDGELEGKVVELSQEGLVLLVSGVDEAGLRQQELGQRLGISRSEILGIESKQLDTRKTGAVTAGFAAVLTVFVLKQFTGFFGGVGERDPPVER